MWSRSPVSESTGIDSLYATYAKFVARSLLRLGVPRPRLEDASQEVFLVATRRYDSYDPSLSTERTWLFGIALRVASNERVRLRRSSRAVERESAFWQVVPDAATPGPEDHATTREGARLVTRALARLAPEKRHLFVLVELESIPVTEVALSLGIKLNTAYGRLRAARLEFRRIIELLYDEESTRRAPFASPE